MQSPAWLRDSRSLIDHTIILLLDLLFYTQTWPNHGAVYGESQGSVAANTLNSLVFCWDQYPWDTVHDCDWSLNDLSVHSASFHWQTKRINEVTDRKGHSFWVTALNTLHFTFHFSPDTHYITSMFCFGMRHILNVNLSQKSFPNKQKESIKHTMSFSSEKVKNKPQIWLFHWTAITNKTLTGEVNNIDHLNTMAPVKGWFGWTAGKNGSRV